MFDSSGKMVVKGRGDCELFESSVVRVGGSKLNYVITNLGICRIFLFLLFAFFCQ